MWRIVGFGVGRGPQRRHCAALVWWRGSGVRAWGALGGRQVDGAEGGSWAFWRRNAASRGGRGLGRRVRGRKAWLAKALLWANAPGGRSSKRCRLCSCSARDWVTALSSDPKAATPPDSAETASLGGISWMMDLQRFLPPKPYRNRPVGGLRRNFNFSWVSDTRYSTDYLTSAQSTVILCGGCEAKKWISTHDFQQPASCESSYSNMHTA